MGLVETQESNGILIATFRDTKILSEAAIQQIGEELAKSADEAAGTSKKLLLNFSGVSFMSSAMIGQLVLLNKKCRTNEVVLKMCSISPDVAGVFKIMKLNKVFDIYKEATKAVAAFDKKGWFG